MPPTSVHEAIVAVAVRGGGLVGRGAVGGGLGGVVAGGDSAAGGAGGRVTGAAAVVGACVVVGATLRVVVVARTAVVGAAELVGVVPGEAVTACFDPLPHAARPTSAITPSPAFIAVVDRIRVPTSGLPAKFTLCGAGAQRSARERRAVRPWVSRAARALMIGKFESQPVAPCGRPGR